MNAMILDATPPQMLAIVMVASFAILVISVSSSASEAAASFILCISVVALMISTFVLVIYTFKDDCKRVPAEVWQRSAGHGGHGEKAVDPTPGG